MLNFKKLTNSNLGGGKTKGFTLIELLAVIVILAVVALVATPIILASVSNAKKSAASSSTLGYIDAVNKYIGLNDIDPDNYPVNLRNYTHYDVSGTTEGTNYLNDVIKVSGDKPIDGWVYIGKNQVERYSLNIDGYIISQIQNEGDEAPTKTVVKASSEDTIKPKGFNGVIKIVYLDPTDLSKTCTKSDVDANVFDSTGSSTEKKDGCMRWYAYSETSTEYKMLLDHNTTARLAFSSTSASTSTMVSEINARLAYDTSAWDIDDSDTSKIKSVSVITGDEIAVIIGKTNATTTWGSTSTSNYFYFDGLGTSKTVTYSSTSRNPYAWLYNNTYGCKDDSTDYGCTEIDNTSYAGVQKSGTSWIDTSSGSMYGYWTSTPAGSSSSVWGVSGIGALDLYCGLADATNYGVRPVITVSKSLVP